MTLSQLNCTNSVFVAALEKVLAIEDGKCAPLVTDEDGDQSLITPWSKEPKIFAFQQNVWLNHDPLASHMSP